MDKLKVLAPATVSNLGCGFDILGFALDLVADEMVITKNNHKKLVIKNINGFGDLPKQPEKNVATVAVQAMLDKLGIRQGFDFEMTKKIKPGSGIGSSAASSAGAVVGVNELLGRPFERKGLVQFVMKGEELASGSMHADNAAPATLGGITLIRSNDPLDLVEIPVPQVLYCVLLHPQIEVKTKDARDILNPQIELKQAVRQWGNVASLIAGLYSNDYDLIGRSLVDHIVEPQRSKLITGYDDLKQAAMDAGALGCNISGSGPSVFALVKGEHAAKRVFNAMETQYKQTGIEFNIYLSSINLEGVKVIKN